MPCPLITAIVVPLLGGATGAWGGPRDHGSRQPA